MKRYTVLAIALVVGVLFSCGSGSNKEEHTEAESSQLSNLEKEHLPELVGYADSVNRGLREDIERGSARLEISGKVGDATVTINHGSPGVRGRVIWNGLVSYDQVWVSGSHWATAITFSDDVKVAETVIPAGMYAFFTIPGRESWTLIINKHYDQHLAEEYTEADDVVRITVTPEYLDEMVQRLKYRVVEVGDKKGLIAMSWEKIRVEMPFEVQ